MSKLNLAFDKASARRYDQDGRLHVALTRVSKANVCPYLGREIPDSDKLGLDENKVYYLLRDPEELEKAAASSNNIQLLMKHIPVSVDDPQKDIVVGSTGTDAAFKKPYLLNSLVVWDAVAIAGIESDEQKELSCGYRYVADMTPGSYEGVSYDGVMREIAFNHIALVEQGRAGSDVVVGDCNILETSMSKITLSRKAAMAKGALAVFLKPKLANDAKIDLSPILAGVTPANWLQSKAKIARGITVASKGKLAQDADISDIVKLLDSLDGEELGDKPDDNLGLDTDPDKNLEGEEAKGGTMEGAVDSGPIDQIRAFLKGKLSDEDMAQIEQMCEVGAMGDDNESGEMDVEALLAKLRELLSGKQPEPVAAQDEPPVTPPGTPAPPATSKEKPMVTKTAMDAALATAIRQAEVNTMKRMQEVADAKELVRPHVGELKIALDSADEIYRVALEAAEVDLTGVPPAAFKAMVQMLDKKAAPVQRDVFAHDSKNVASFAARFPTAGKVTQLG